MKLLVYRSIDMSHSLICRLSLGIEIEGWWKLLGHCHNLVHMNWCICTILLVVLLALH